MNSTPNRKKKPENGVAGGTGESRFDARFKVLLLGNSGVGKTSLIRTLMGEPFHPTNISTIGIDLNKKIFTVENQRIQLEIWDTAGQEQYHSIVSFHFREAKAFIMVYDITSLPTFDQLRKYWLRFVDQNMDDPVPVFFVGNKSDLSNARQVTIEQGKQLTVQQSGHGHFETSAKSSQNVQRLFQSVAEAMVSTWGVPKRLYEIDNGTDGANGWSYEQTNPGTVRLDVIDRSRKTQKCCVLK